MGSDFLCFLFSPFLCLGWVRYAERVLGRPIIPHLCTAKSPQQVMGSLVKDYFARRQVSRQQQETLLGSSVLGASGSKALPLSWSFAPGHKCHP